MQSQSQSTCARTHTQPQRRERELNKVKIDLHDPQVWELPDRPQYPQQHKAFAKHVKDATVRCGLCSRKNRAFGTETQCRKAINSRRGQGTGRARTQAWWVAAVHLPVTLALFCSCSPALRCSQELPTCSSLANQPLACFRAEPGLMWVRAAGVWYSTTLLPSFILLPSSPLGSASTCFAPICVPGTAGAGTGILERQDSVWRCLHWELLLWWEKGEGHSKCKGDPCSLYPWTSNQHSVINLMVSKENERKRSCSVVSDSLLPHGLWPTGLLHSWDLPGKSTGVGCHFLLQAIFPTQE